MNPRTLRDENDREYVFVLPDQNDAATRIPGLVLIAKDDKPVYIGETHDIHGFIRKSDWVNRALEEHGATGIYVCRGRHDPAERRAAKTALVRRNSPILNPATDHL